MISVLLEGGRTRPSAGVGVAVAAMLGSAFCASLVAGAASPGAGLGVLAIGLFAATVADFALWRDMMDREPRTVEAERYEALAPPVPSRALVVDAPQEAIPA